MNHRLKFPRKRPKLHPKSLPKGHPGHLPRNLQKSHQNHQRGNLRKSRPNHQLGNRQKRLPKNQRRLHLKARTKYLLKRPLNPHPRSKQSRLPKSLAHHQLPLPKNLLKQQALKVKQKRLQQSRPQNSSPQVNELRSCFPKLQQKSVSNMSAVFAK